MSVCQRLSFGMMRISQMSEDEVGGLWDVGILSIELTHLIQRIFMEMDNGANLLVRSSNVAQIFVIDVDSV